MVDQKVRNIRRDLRVSLSIEAEGSTYGMQHYLVVEGTARIDTGGAPELLRDLAQRYIGPGTEFPPMPNPPAGSSSASPHESRRHGPLGPRVLDSRWRPCGPSRTNPRAGVCNLSLLNSS